MWLRASEHYDIGLPCLDDELLDGVEITEVADWVSSDEEPEDSVDGDVPSDSEDEPEPEPNPPDAESNKRQRSQ